MKRIPAILLLFLLNTAPLFADEGMWIPALLEQLNIRSMQQMGLKLSAEEIYSVNGSSLKDAVVMFGGGCTAAIVSSRGLILTNHHCGYGTIQRLSSLDHDYLTDGFWARSLREELACPELTVSRLERMEDVTAKILEGIDATTDQQSRAKLIRKNSETLEKEAMKGTCFEAKVRSFFSGNQFFLIVSEVFKDIRFVGAPPSAVGNFGGDTDNWMWPRHTGDFSVFRIYAGKDNKPAPYDTANVPYQPRKHLPVSLKGYEKQDFTFVLGYPGGTKEYLSSDALALIVQKEDPLRITLRQKRLEIIRDAMDSDPLVRLQYAAKAAGIANAWKKMIGESRGIRLQDGVEKKRRFETQFRTWAEKDSTLNQKYGGLIAAFSQVYQTYASADLANYYINEGAFGIEAVRFANNFEKLENLCRDRAVNKEDLNKELAGITRSARDFFKNFNAGVDRKLMVAMAGEMSQGMDPEYLPGIFTLIREKYGNDLGRYASDLFSRSFLADSCGVYSFLGSFKKSSIRKLQRDPLYQFSKSIYQANRKRLQPVMTVFSQKIDSLQRIYMAGQMEMNAGKTIYPDANSTFRVAYGRVNDLSPTDAVSYRYYTTLDGLMQKEDESVADYRVDPGLKALYLQRDFGRYADRDGTMHIAFIAGNHTSGGNSGSPVLNGSGELIGLNFDRNWEGTQSDLMYDPSQCRNIILDIRYCLFIIEKLGGANQLTGEMEIRE